MKYFYVVNYRNKSNTADFSSRGGGITEFGKWLCMWREKSKFQTVNFTNLRITKK